MRPPPPHPAATWRQAEHNDLLYVDVPESYATVWPKIVACWRWSVATHEFRYWVHAGASSSTIST